jgi:hypothetical protein
MSTVRFGALLVRHVADAILLLQNVARYVAARSSGVLAAARRAGPRDACHRRPALRSVVGPCASVHRTWKITVYSG